MEMRDAIIEANQPILVTGGAGFIGVRVVENLLARGFRNVRALVRPSTDTERLHALQARFGEGAHLQIVRGNLLSPADCERVVGGVALVYHLAAGRGEKAFADAFMNSVVTTRNLLEACRKQRCLKRFVNTSSFSVYSNRRNPCGRLLNESSPMDEKPERRGDAYTFAKIKQDEIVLDYGKRFSIPFVIVRPGVVYGPGNHAIHPRVGIGTFGLFLHLGGANNIPLTYVDNCAEAITLAGLRRGLDGEVFNVVDDDLVSSRRFLRLYKGKVRRFKSVYVPHAISYLLCLLWEKYSAWSEGQLPAVYSRARWNAYWKRTEYSNEKIKKRLGWTQNVPSAEALERHFESCRKQALNA